MQVHHAIENKVPRRYSLLIFDMIITLSVIAIALYFRTLPLQKLSLASNANLARSVVYKKLIEQLSQQMNGFAPVMSKGQKQKMAEKRADEIIRSEKAHFEKTISEMSEAFRKHAAPGQSRRYLLEADPYYYYYLTREIVRNGRISPVTASGRFFNAKRAWPDGWWAVMTWHPWLGAIWHQLVHWLNPSIDLIESLCYFPLVLVVFIVIEFVILCFLLGCGRLSTFISGCVFGLSPIFMGRSCFGWFDTDPYQFLFPIAVICVLILGIRGKLSIFLTVLLSGFLSGIYSLFWAGWFFILGITAAAGVLTKLFCASSNRDFADRVGQICSGYVVSALMFAIFFLTPSGFLEVIGTGWEFLHRFARQEADIWPNAFMTVGEAMPITLKKLMYLCGNPGVSWLVWLGLIGSPLLLLQKKNPTFFGWCFFTVYFISTALISLSTERFAVLAVTPFVILIAFGIELVVRIFSSVTSVLIHRIQVARIIKVFGACILLAFLLPVTIVSAYVVMTSQSTMIMNDTWFSALKEIREKTPEDSVIYSWWPPGYFILSLAERRVLSDGGSQHLPQLYWIARSLLTDRETQALGIIRMLTSSGNEATDFLVSKGLDYATTVQTIAKAVTLTKNDVHQLLSSRLRDQDLTEFLNLIQANQKLLPTYIFLYNDLIEQNLAVSLMANWDFDKAAIQASQKDKSGSLSNAISFLPKMLQAGLHRSFEQGMVGVSGNISSANFRKFLNEIDQRTSRNFKNYISRVGGITGEFWKYSEESPQVKAESGRVYFANGLTLQLESMDCLFEPMGSSADSQIRPVSVIYFESDKLVENKFFGKLVDVSALVYEKNGLWYSVLADRRLLRSVLFRLYYSKGKGLRFVKPFLDFRESETNTAISVFEIDWKDFLDKVNSKMQMEAEV